MRRIKDDATFADFLEYLVNDEVLRRSYEGNNHVYKVTLTLDEGQGSKLQYVFETPKGFNQDQRTRTGTIDTGFD